jgi:phytoene dehydrogenase-like protein
MIDAAVIGSGPNGLVAANVLMDHGWTVTVFEEQPDPGGAVRSGEITVPGFTHDRFSAFYPLAAASPVIRRLELERWGLVWERSQGVVAHPLRDGSCALLSRDLDETAASLDAYADGDGDAWRALYAQWEQVGGAIVEALMTPFPPVRTSAKLAAALRRDLVRFARFGLLPVRRLAEETFAGAGGANLLAGNALHADLTPDSLGGGLFGWLLCGLGQQHGFPVPRGGAGQLTEALVRRLRAGGGDVVCGQKVDAVLAERGRTTGIRLADGTKVPVARAVLADTGAPQLYEQLLPAGSVPSRTRDDLRKFQYDDGAIKVDWALDGPIPWTAPDARRAGTVHVADGIDALTDTTAKLATGRIPDRPFLVMGQYSMVDTTRAPAGQETAWAYTHVPRRTKGDAGGDDLSGRWDARELDTFAARMEHEVELLAPGFRDRIVGRNIAGPHELEAQNRNLVGGAVNSGTAQLYQQLLFRPVPGLGRPETPVRGCYLASASAHPGGGVHGGAGGNAARVALAHDRLRRITRR